MPIENVIYEFNKCEEYNYNYRIEHVFDLTTIYRNKSLWKTSKIISDHAHNILLNRKCNATLFVEKDIYSWRFYDNFSIILYYNGFVKESLDVINYILTNFKKSMPENELERIENNKMLISNNLKDKK